VFFIGNMLVVKGLILLSYCALLSFL